MGQTTAICVGGMINIFDVDERFPETRRSPGDLTSCSAWADVADFGAAVCHAGGYTSDLDCVRQPRGPLESRIAVGAGRSTSHLCATPMAHQRPGRGLSDSASAWALFLDGPCAEVVWWLLAFTARTAK